MGAVHKAIQLVMRDVSAIGKDRKNTQQGYAFRGVDDAYYALHDVMAKHGLFTMPQVMEDRTEERQTKTGSNLIYRILKIKFVFTSAEDGSTADAIMIGEGMDSGDKASNKAMSVAHKYALLQVFCIPTEENKDPENDHHEVRPKAASVSIPSAIAPKASDKTAAEKERAEHARKAMALVSDRLAKELDLTDAVARRAFVTAVVGSKAISDFSDADFAAIHQAISDFSSVNDRKLF